MSSLKPGVERFLGRLCDSSLEKHWRSPGDFLRHFGPPELIGALSDAPEVRTRLLVEAAGVHARIAAKKSAESAIEDLQISLEEGIANAGTIVSLLPPDDQARYLPRIKLWSYLTEEPFWSNGKPDSVSRVTFVVSLALEEGLLTYERILESLNLDSLVDVLPPDELKTIAHFALAQGRGGTAVTELAVLELLSMEKLFGFSSVNRLWEELIVAQVASPCGLIEGEAPEPQPRSGKKELSEPTDTSNVTTVAESAAVPSAAAPANVVVPTPGELDELFEEVGDDDELAENSLVSSTVGAEPAPEMDEGAAPSSGAVAVAEPEAQPDEPPAPRTPQEEESRKKASERLLAVDRLPPNWESLPTPLLLSIDSMYAELLSAEDDDARMEIIHDSYPNEALLRSAMLALIELLDPGIDVNDELIAGADADSLIKIVVFEERNRFEAGSAKHSVSASTGPRVSTPPPLPKADPSRRMSTVPPPLPRPGAVGGKRGR